MSQKLKFHNNWNVTKKYDQNGNLTKTDMSPKLKCHQIWNVTKTEVSPKLNCHQNWSVIKTEMLPKLKCYQTLLCPQKSKSKFKRSALNTLVLLHVRLVISKLKVTWSLQAGGGRGAPWSWISADVQEQLLEVNKSGHIRTYHDIWGIVSWLTMTNYDKLIRFVMLLKQHIQNHAHLMIKLYKLYSFVMLLKQHIQTHKHKIFIESSLGDAG